MSRLFPSALIAISLVFSASTAFAQTPKHKMSPGEMAAADTAKAEKTAACRVKAKEQKLSLRKRRAFVKSCVAA